MTNNDVERISETPEKFINFISGITFRTFLLVIEYAPECVLSIRDSHMIAVRYDASVGDFLIYGMGDLHDYNTPLVLHKDASEIIKEL